MSDTAEIAGTPAGIKALDDEIREIVQSIRRGSFDASRRVVSDMLRLPMRMEEEISTLRQRAERAEARTVELEAAIKRQAAAAKMGMDAAHAISTNELQQARLLFEASSPAALDSQREANDRLTNELEAAQSTIAELREALKYAPHAQSCPRAHNPLKSPDKCNCWKRAALGKGE